MKRAFLVPILTITGFLLLNIASYATEAYPSNWFVNMKYNKVQVLLRSADADFSKSTIAVNYPGVQLKKTHHFSQKNRVPPDDDLCESTT